jgi:hypothetical protein
MVVEHLFRGEKDIVFGPDVGFCKEQVGSTRERGAACAKVHIVMCVAEHELVVRAQQRPDQVA